MQKYLRISKKSSTFAPAFREKLRGAIAQLVEQRTENPCVPGSIPGGTTSKKRSIRVSFLVPTGLKPGFSAAFALSIIVCKQCSIPGGTTEKKISIDKGHKVFKVRKDFREQKRP